MEYWFLTFIRVFLCVSGLHEAQHIETEWTLSVQLRPGRVQTGDQRPGYPDLPAAHQMHGEHPAAHDRCVHVHFIVCVSVCSYKLILLWYWPLHHGFPQFLACWNTRPSKVCRGWSPPVSESGRLVSLTRAPTPWTPSCGSSAPSTPPCASTAPTPSSSSRWWSSNSTSSEPSPSTTCCCAKTCAPGAKACRSGRRCRCSERSSRARVHLFVLSYVVCLCSGTMWASWRSGSETKVWWYAEPRRLWSLWSRPLSCCRWRKRLTRTPRPSAPCARPSPLLR